MKLPLNKQYYNDVAANQIKLSEQDEIKYLEQYYKYRRLLQSQILRVDGGIIYLHQIS